MKKFILIFAMACIGFASHAQNGSPVKMPLVAGDTITNTGVVTKVLPSITGGYSGASITVKAHVLSGTGAGTVVLQGTSDNTTTPVWTAIGSSYTITNVDPNGITFTVTAPLPYKLRVVATGSGTESTVISVFYRIPFYQIR